MGQGSLQTLPLQAEVCGKGFFVALTVEFGDKLRTGGES